MAVVVRLDIEPSPCSITVRYRPHGAAASAQLLSEEHKVDRSSLLAEERLKIAADQLMRASEFLEKEHMHLVEAALEELRVLLSQSSLSTSPNEAPVADAEVPRQVEESRDLGSSRPFSPATIQECRVVLLNMAGERLGCVEGATSSSFWDFGNQVRELSGVPHLEQVLLWGEVQIAGQGVYRQMVETGGTQEVHVIRKSTCLSRVAVRCRPIYDREMRAGVIQTVFADSSARTVRIQAQPTKDGTAANEESAGESGSVAEYSGFDAVFGEDASQEEVSDWMLGDSIKQAVDMDGGTTFLLSAMPSPDRALIAWNEDAENPGVIGVIPKAIHIFFQELAALPDDEQSERMVTVSFASQYNEEQGDLLDGMPPGRSPRLRLREGLRTGIYASGLSETVVKGPDEALALLRQGRTKSQVECTTMERTESDYGFIFTISVWKRQPIPDEAPMLSPCRLRFVILPSMRQFRTPEGLVAQGPGRTVASFMNVLKALCQARTATIDGSRPRFVPFRDSSLTRLLQLELSGSQGQLVVLALCNPFDDETLQTVLELARLLQGIRCSSLVPRWSAQDVRTIWFNNPDEPSEGAPAWQATLNDHLTRFLSST